MLHTQELWLHNQTFSSQIQTQLGFFADPFAGRPRKSLMGGREAVVLHDGERVQLLVERPLPEVARPSNAISRKRRKELTYDPEAPAAKRTLPPLLV